MADNSEYLLGEISGKLDSLTSLVKDNIADNTRRFSEVYKGLEAHSADINKAKGAKGALILAAGGVSGLVAAVAAAAQHLLK